MSSKTTDYAATKALQGDVQGALSDIGQASHTAQDIVRHDFKTASQHPFFEAPATATETQAAMAATQNVLDQFAEQLEQQSKCEYGMDVTEIETLMDNVRQGGLATDNSGCTSASSLSQCPVESDGGRTVSNHDALGGP